MYDPFGGRYDSVDKDLVAKTHKRIQTCKGQPVINMHKNYGRDEIPVTIPPPAKIQPQNN